MKLRENKNLVWSSDAQQDYYFGMDKDELINEVESMGEVEDFLRIRGYDDIEEADEDELRSFLLPSDIDLDYEDFTESVMPMIKEQCANDILVLWGKGANWPAAYDAGAVIDVDEFKKYVYPDYDAISEIYSDNGNLYYIQYSHDTPTGGDTMYLYSFKDNKAYENACHLRDEKDDDGGVMWDGDFETDAGYAEIAKAIEMGYLTPVTNRFNEGLEDSLQERNLTKAERHNRDMERIFNYKKATDNAMKDFLVKNGVSNDDAENLRKQDKLDNKLRDMGLHDMFFDDYLKNESLNEGRYSDYADDETRANGWWYFTTHGVGPGSVPKDLNVLEVKEGQNKKGTWGDYVRLDGILNTDELDYYDMIELAPTEEEEDFTGFFSDYDFDESLDEEAKNIEIRYDVVLIYADTYKGENSYSYYDVFDNPRYLKGKKYFANKESAIKQADRLYDENKDKKNTELNYVVRELKVKPMIRVNDKELGSKIIYNANKNSKLQLTEDTIKTKDFPKDIVDNLKYLAYHRTKGMTKRQEYDLQDASDALEKGDFNTAYRIIDNIYHYVNKNLSSSVYNDLGDIFDAMKKFADSSLNEDTVKTSDGKWTNKGKEGTHGKFKTKKEADAQRRAMFANNFKG